MCNLIIQVKSVIVETVLSLASDETGLGYSLSGFDFL